MRSGHEQGSRQVVEKDRTNPAWHSVSSWRFEVPVDDDDSDQNGDDVHDECEQEVLGNQWNRDRRRRKNLGNEQQEDDQGEKDGNTHRHLLPGVSRQVEHRNGQEGDEDARNDEVDSVKERLTPDLERESDLSFVMLLDWVQCVVVDSRAGHDVPRAAVDVITQVDPLLAFIPVQNYLHFV